ncbi:MAG: hypothetical protein HYT94_05485 [Parcubacteria group bacterium]|nr:hypothetical protein [Parcubacteria group bacterium]
MRDDKEKVIALRKSGKSYNEIMDVMRISKSTLSAWLAPHNWSQNISQTLAKRASNKGSVHLRELNDIRGKHLEHVYREAVAEAAEEYQKLKYHPLFIAGIMLYWGEGDKVTKYFVRITNTDPAIIKIFANFLFEICGIKKEKIACSLLLYPDLIENDCKKYWISNSGLEGLKFHKSQVIKGKHKTNRLRYGVCTLTINSSYFKKKIVTWTQLLSQELLTAEYYKPQL